MAKAKELKEQSIEQLQETIQDLRKQLFEDQFKHGTRQLTDTAAIARAKKDIARALTVLREKQRAQQAAA